MRARHNSPDPVGLAIAREIQERVRPAEIILSGSRAVGDHRRRDTGADHLVAQDCGEPPARI